MRCVLRWVGSQSRADMGQKSPMSSSIRQNGQGTTQLNDDTDGSNMTLGVLIACHRAPIYVMKPQIEGIFDNF